MQGCGSRAGFPLPHCLLQGSPAPGPSPLCSQALAFTHLGMKQIEGVKRAQLYYCGQ